MCIWLALFQNWNSNYLDHLNFNSFWMISLVQTNWQTSTSDCIHTMLGFEKRSNSGPPQAAGSAVSPFKHAGLLASLLAFLPMSANDGIWHLHFVHEAMSVVHASVACQVLLRMEFHFSSIVIFKVRSLTTRSLRQACCTYIYRLICLPMMEFNISRWLLFIWQGLWREYPSGIVCSCVLPMMAFDISSCCQLPSSQDLW